MEGAHDCDLKVVDPSHIINKKKTSFDIGRRNSLLTNRVLFVG